MCLQTKGEKAAEEGKVEQSIGIAEAKEVGVINTFVCENCVALTTLNVLQSHLNHMGG